MTPKSEAWLLLITNLPGKNPTLRMRIYRALKAAGTGLLRDGAYLLPNSSASREALEEQAQEIRAAGGLAHVLAFNSDSPEQAAVFTALFDRTTEYVGCIAEIDKFKRELTKLVEPDARLRLSTIARDVASAVSRDFFPGESRKQVEIALTAAEAAINNRFSPNEPHPSRDKIRRRALEDYRARTWATREHLWIDRVASAWLIRRFIDPEAKFVWLKRIKDCPKRALGFDFDGAEFTHVDSKVTFEVLVTSFGLEGDPGITRLGALVHHLDVGGIPIAEGPGLTAVMTGARTLHPSDDALLTAMTPMLDSLYAAYSNTASA